MRFIMMLTLTTALASHAAAQSAERARALIAKADSITAKDDFGRKAQMYVQAARMLPRGDKDVGHALFQAGTLYYYRGNLGRAQELLEQAAQESSFRGDVSRSAQVYLTALVVALERRDRSDVRRLIDYVTVLAASPAMPEAERGVILQKVAQPLAALASRNSPH